MSAEPQVHVAQDPEALAGAVTSRLLAAVAEAGSRRATVHVVLTGGRVAGRVLRALGTAPAAASVDWGRVHLWWGDERFLPAGHADRNETQAREALDGSPVLTRAVLHPMPSSDGLDGDDPAAAARRYAGELAEHAVGARRAGGPPVPAFDVLLLGVGPDGHVASLFPGAGSLDVTDVTVLAELASPKPPPVRLTLTYPALTAARQVWCVVAGQDKAEAVARGLGGEEAHAVPAAAARGTETTLWLLDTEAASRL